MKQNSPLEFFSHLRWLDGRPLLDTVCPYRQKIFMDALYTFDPDGRPRYNLALCGRGKKNWKTADLSLAALYKLIAWQSPHGNDCYVLANDLDQARDDLALIKKLIDCNRLLDAEVDVKRDTIERRDGKGVLQILPAQDAVGQHGKTYLFCAFDEIHGYRNWDIFEGLAHDPTRLDSMQWITSYASIRHTPGVPLFDLVARGKRGDDPRMYFNWYSGDYCTDPAFADLDPEKRANPSMESWGNPDYLEQQRRRLPTHKFRRLHLNLPGMPDGTFYDATKVLDCVAERRRSLPFVLGREYRAFVDMSGGSSDDAVLAIGHIDRETKRRVLDLVATQTGRAPFNPREAVKKFAAICKEYGVFSVIGDAYAGETFRQDFTENGIGYTLSSQSKSALYEALEPLINAQAVELLDEPKMLEQLLGLVVRGSKIDHMPGEHDDLCNAAAGVLVILPMNGEIDLDDCVTGTDYTAAGYDTPWSTTP